MIYLDNAATSYPKLPEVMAAMTQFAENSAGNPGRSGHRLALAAQDVMDRCRLELCRLFDGHSPNQFIFTSNGTDSLNLAIHGLFQNPMQTAHVITTCLEHNSVSRPLETLSRTGRIELTRVSCSDEGFVSPHEIERAIQPNTRLVVVTHASNVLGTIQDIQSIGEICRKNNLLFLVDAAQTAGIIPLSFKVLDADLIAFPGHKGLLGPSGTGVLYVHPRVKSLLPIKQGGTGGDSASPLQPQEMPHLFESGTPNTFGIAGLCAAVKQLNKNGINILEHDQMLCEALVQFLQKQPHFTLYGPTERKKCVGTISLNMEGFEPIEISAILDESFSIATRPGLHCSPYCHRALGTFPSGTVRISFGPSNTLEDVQTLVDALSQISS